MFPINVRSGGGNFFISIGVGRPLGMPPRVTSSSPLIPVGAFSSVPVSPYPLNASPLSVHFTTDIFVCRLDNNGSTLLVGAAGLEFLKL